RGWKIGSQEDDNPSALLLVAIDNRKYFTQISKDLEDELPDGLAGQLQRQNLVPAFKQGDYGKGITDTIEAYIRTIEQRGSGEAVTTEKTQKPERSRARGGGLGGICNFVTCLIILFVLMMIIFSRSGRGGGGRGGFGGGGDFGGGGAGGDW
ncbi:MAG: TPM domain-containing protein, partial [Acidobacteria bacterium]|nr:TPM domain-containing protein [Acidobacteriota bacterium]